MPVPRDLVFALCHEVKNLLAAQRLQCQLLDDKQAASRISELAPRAGSLLAGRPLTQRVARSVVERCGRGFEFEIPAEGTRVALRVPRVEH